MKTYPQSPPLKSKRNTLRLLGRGLLVAAGLALGNRAGAADATNQVATVDATAATHPAEKAGSVAPAEKADGDKKAAPAEQEVDEAEAVDGTELANSLFEGGTNLYSNWIEMSGGGLFTTGSKSQAEQDRRLAPTAFGGISDLHLQQEIAKKTTAYLDGRGIFDEHDYQLRLGVRREDLYFAEVNFENFRTWYNGNGGFYQPDKSFYPLGDEALALDRGELSFAAGLTLKDLPSLTFKYTHAYREGEKSSTIWGQTHPSVTYPSRGLTPSFYSIDEERNIFELDSKYQIKTTELGAGVRYETGTADNALKISQNPGEPPVFGVPQDRKITDRQGTTSDLLNVHAFSETWLNPSVFFSAGYMYDKQDNNLTGSRIYGDDFDVQYSPNRGNGLGYTNLIGTAQQTAQVLNLNLMTLPLKQLTIVPSVRVSSQDWDADSSGIGTLTVNQQPFQAKSDGSLFDVRERLDLRYTGVTNWVLYTGGEWTQGEGSLNENGGLSQVNGIGVPPVNRNTDDRRFFQKYFVGARWYPLRRVTLDVGGYYKNNQYDYDNTLDRTPNDPASVNRYPAYLVMQNFETYDGNTRLTLRPWQKVTLVTRYEYQLSTIYTAPDSVSELSEEQSGKMTSQIISQNVSWAPWSRLYLQVGFNYVLSETTTPASTNTAILDAQNNYWSVNFNSGFVVNDKTDLNLGYTYYQADNYHNPDPLYLAYGAGAEEHGITATLIRRITDNLRVTLRYGYYHYTDQTSGGNNNYDAQVVYSSLQYRF